MGTTISVLGGLSAVFLLTIAYLWEIPFFLFLSAKFGMFVSVFAGAILSVSGIITVSDSSFWWLYHAAVPVRLMCPALGLLPNGLPVPMGSELGNTNVILTGIGENTWCYVPCAWASRMISCMISKSVRMQAFDTKCFVAVLLCGVLTVCATFLFGIWACHWEGQQTNG